MKMNYFDGLIAREFETGSKCSADTRTIWHTVGRTSIAISLTLLSASVAHASVESSLIGLKSVLLGSVLPICAVLGLGFAAFSFFTGNINAKQHLIYAVTGSVILFGAQSIVDLIERVVR